MNTYGSQFCRSAPEWNRVYTALGGDSPFEIMQADFSRQPEAIRFVDVFLAAHHQRAVAEENPATTFTAEKARVCIDQAEAAISEFLSVQPEQCRAFAVQVLLGRPTGGTHGAGEASVRQ